MTNRKNENVTNFMETHIMYLIRRCWFLKCSEEIYYVPIGDGDMWYYVPVDDGWEEVLGHAWQAGTLPKELSTL